MSENSEPRLVSLDRELKDLEADIALAERTYAPPELINQFKQEYVEKLMLRRRQCGEVARRAIPAVIAHFERGSKTN